MCLKWWLNYENIIQWDYYGIKITGNYYGFFPSVSVSFLN